MPQSFRSGCDISLFKKFENDHRNFMINFKSMGQGGDRTHDPWICSQTCICSRFYSRVLNSRYFLQLDHAQILTRCETVPHPKFMKDMSEAFECFSMKKLYFGISNENIAVKKMVKYHAFTQVCSVNDQ